MATISELKRELEELNRHDLIQTCLRMAKLKIENKDFLTYLLRDADDPVFYAETLKPSITQLLQEGAPNKYLFAKLLRKTNKLIARYARFTGNKQGELELILHQIATFHEFYRFEWKSAAVARIVSKSLLKIGSLILKQHDELRADYQPQFSELINLSVKRLGREYFEDKSLQYIN